MKLTDIKGVYAYGFERPSAIQQRAIMPVIKGMTLFHMQVSTTNAALKELMSSH